MIISDDLDLSKLDNVDPSAYLSYIDISKTVEKYNVKGMLPSPSRFRV